MPIKFCSGDLFASGAQALVNTVNCRGAMGKGIALEFKKRYPQMFAAYQKECAAGAIKTGRVSVYRQIDLHEERLIINFPTKDDWRNPSQLKWIKEGLIHLAYVLGREKVASVAIPALGCSNGGLSWLEVRPIMAAMLAPLGDDLEILIYEPHQ